MDVAKAEDKAARFVTVIYPFGAADTYAQQNITAEFIDNTPGNEGTFHENGVSVKVVVNGVQYSLSYNLN